MKLIPGRKVVQELLSNPKIKRLYNEMEDDFKLYDQIIKARKASGMTQAEIAKAMGTTKSAVSRLEATGKHKKYSPSLNTLHKYAAALGCKLKIELVRQ